MHSFMVEIVVTVAKCYHWMQRIIVYIHPHQSERTSSVLFDYYFSPGCLPVVVNGYVKANGRLP